MRKLIILFLGISLLWATTLEDVLQKNYKAKGGLEKLKAVKTIYVEGKINAQGMEMPFKTWVKLPDKIRMETVFQGQKMVQAYDGKQAWWIMPMLGTTEPQPMPPQQAKQFKDQMQFRDPLVYYKELGYKLQYLGDGDFEGTPVHKLKLTKTNGDVMVYYIDKDSGLELKADVFSKRQGREIRAELIYGDYNQVDGLVFPFYLETRMGGKTVSQITMSKYEINKPIDDSLFEMKGEGKK